MIKIEFTPHTTTTPVLIGRGLLKGKAFLDFGKRFVIITDSTVKRLYGTALQKHLQSLGLSVLLISFPAGEKYKSRKTKEKIENEMLSHKLGKDTCVIGLGGGVVTDLAGFVAATYGRGIPFISIPTTLLGMVDASIGGKTGINTPEGKNLLGSYYSPDLILMDLNTLDSLPKKEYINGMAEVIKYGLIGSEKLFKLVNSNKKPNIKQIIELSVKEKKKVIEKDPQEKGLRRILNFGHTLGHAIESAANYKMGHGEAIALGMIGESYMSMRMGFLSAEHYSQVCDIFKQYGFALKLPKGATLEVLNEKMMVDKKSTGSRPRFVMIESIGKVKSFRGEYCTPVEDVLIIDAIKRIKNE